MDLLFVAEETFFIRKFEQRGQIQAYVLPTMLPRCLVFGRSSSCRTWRKRLGTPRRLGAPMGSAFIEGQRA